MNRFEWISVTSVDEALYQLSEGAVAKAGGIDLLDRMKEGIDKPARIVNLRTIRGLDHLRIEGDVLHLGAMTTLASIGDSPEIRRRWPAIADAALGAATPQIRNAATLGGNLLQRPRCWYFRSEEFDCLKKGGERCFAIEGENQYHAIFDNDVCAAVHASGMAVPLMAYRAVVDIAGRGGRRTIAMDELFQHPHDDVEREHTLASDEMVVGVRVPDGAPVTKGAYIKQGEKESFDWPVADVAAVLEMDARIVRRASIVLGAAGPVPRRATEAEAYLQGEALDERAAQRAGQIAMEGTTPLGKNGYKVSMFRTIVARAIMAAR